MYIRGFSAQNTQAPMPQESLTDEELRSISWAVFNRYGLDFTEYEPVSLKRRILRIIHRYELESVYGLWKKILYDADFMAYFRDEVSVGMTEMFRNPDFWAYLRDDLFPNAPRKNSLRIWHAGCSTGEEVYSAAIVLDELGLLAGARALATDLSDNFIQEAQKATYERSLIRKYEKCYKTYNTSASILPYFEMDEEGEFLPKRDDLFQRKTENGRARKIPPSLGAGRPFDNRLFRRYARRLQKTV